MSRLAQPLWRLVADRAEGACEYCRSPVRLTGNDCTVDHILPVSRGGTDDPEKVKQAFEILIKANPSVILLNIFGGITKADTVALGVQQALEDMHTRIPVVARIKGVNEDRAKEILRSIGMYATETMEEAAELAVKVKSGGA